MSSLKQQHTTFISLFLGCRSKTPQTHLFLLTSTFRSCYCEEFLTSIQTSDTWLKLPAHTRKVDSSILALGTIFYFSYFLVRVCVKQPVIDCFHGCLCLVSLLKLSGHLNDAMSQFYRLFLAIAQKIRRWPYIVRKDVQWNKSHNQTVTFRLFDVNKTAFTFILLSSPNQQHTNRQL